MAGYQEAVVASGPTHYYGMDSLTATVGTNMTTGAGTLTFAAGPNTFLSNGMVFNGSSFGVIPRTVTDAFTIEFFIKTTQSGATGVGWYVSTGIVAQEVAGVTNDLGVVLWGSSIGLGAGSPDTLVLGPTVNDGSWHHIAITRNSGSVEFWKNGVLNNTATGFPTNTFGANASFAVGALTTAGAGLYVGMLDELAIYTRKLTGTEIANHYIVRALDSAFYQVVG